MSTLSAELFLKGLFNRIWTTSNPQKKRTPSLLLRHARPALRSSGKDFAAQLLRRTMAGIAPASIRPRLKMQRWRHAFSRDISLLRQLITLA
jgi:hypothetical protein